MFNSSKQHYFPKNPSSGFAQVAQQFFLTLWGEGQVGEIVLWEKPKIGSNRYYWSKPDSMQNLVQNLSPDSDIFFTVSLHEWTLVEKEKRKKGESPDRSKNRGTNHSAIAIPGFWADIDCQEGSHKEKHLPTLEEAKAFLQGLSIRPSIVVCSGGGLHAYWLFENPWSIKNNEERNRASALLRHFQAKLREQISEKGWSLDSTADLARFLRVPGTLNHKTDPPKKVEIVEFHQNRRYTSEKLELWTGPLHDQKTNRQSKYPPCDNWGKSDAYKIAKKCAWFRHCREDAKILSEPEWFAMLSIVGLCVNGSELAHQWSASYPDYTADETDKKLQHAVQDGGPRTCRNISSELGADKYCKACQYHGKVTSPIQLGRPDAVEEANKTIQKHLPGISKDNPKPAFEEEFLEAAAVLKEQSAGDFAILRNELKGKVDLRDWRSFVSSKAKRIKSQRKNTGIVCQSKNQKPLIRINDIQLRTVIDKAWEAINAPNRSEPFLFIRDGSLVRIAKARFGYSIELVNDTYMYGLLARVADWCFETDKRFTSTKPCKDTARDMVENPNPDLPPLEAIISTPVFSDNGRLIDQAGHHREHRLYLVKENSITVDPVPENPTTDKVQAALDLILTELLGEFPFKDDPDKAHALAAFLQPFVRRMIEGPTPLHSIEAPAAGSGKTLLCNLISMIVSGQLSQTHPLPRNEEEMRKLLTSILIGAPQIVVLDNANPKHDIDSSSLSGVLTSCYWKDRILGLSKTISVPNKALWLLTGNNPRYSTELARRCIRIRIDPKQDRPWERKNFRHGDLPGWARGNRPKLIHALLVLIQNWIAAGRPCYKKKLGSFEQWSEVIGGILECAGVFGFLDKLNEIYEVSDAESEQWREFTAAWWEKHQDNPVSVSELFNLCDRNELLGEVLGDRSDHSKSIRLGRGLKINRDRVYGKLRIELAKDKGHKGKHYRLINIDLGAQEKGECLPQKTQHPPQIPPPHSPTQDAENTSSCEKGGMLGSVLPDPMREKFLDTKENDK